MMHKTNIFYSLPEVWDFCLEKIYNKEQYIGGLIEALEKRGITKKSLLLDAGCGSGFPSLDLIERGYRVIGIDKSSEMVRQIQLNAEKRGVSIEAYHIMWSDLAKRFDQMFDCVYCRGNSLIYAASWEQNWIVPLRSREEIAVAIKNFFMLLKPGGLLYVDVTRKDEKPHGETIGTVSTKNGPVEMTWKIEHDNNNRVRTWTIKLKFLNTGQAKEYPSYSYLVSREEILNFFLTSGFKNVEEDVKVNGEKNYDVYIAYK